MPTKYSSIEELRKEIIRKANELYESALTAFPQERRRLEISFDIAGRVAGRAHPMHAEGCHWLQFNLGLAWENPETFMSDTVPHEVSHLIADTFFIDVWKQGVGHSDLWGFVVQKLGYKTARCHRMPVTESSREISRNARIAVADDI